MSITSLHTSGEDLSFLLAVSVKYERVKAQNQILIGLLKTQLETFEAKFESEEEKAFISSQYLNYLIAAKYVQRIEPSKEREGYIKRIEALRDRLPF
jgi:hypothetical protein